MAVAFKLSAQLSGHDKDVRAVEFPSPQLVVSTSRDNTVRVWRKKTAAAAAAETETAAPSFESTIVTQGSEFINSIAYLPPSTEYPDGLVISGARDGIIDVRLPGSDPTHDAMRLLVSHSNNVGALDIAPSGKFLVSGGWDGQAIVWSVERWEPEVVLEGHGAGEEYNGVLDVLAYGENTVITGCADHMIRVYNLRQQSGGTVQPSITLPTPQIVRALCRLPAGHPSGGNFASAGNDGVIRLWKLGGGGSGQQVAELRGHTNFIYSLDCLPNGELVSASEDRSVRIWRGTECIQTITHPAISVWSVSVCRENGDIVTGASDGVARIFTRSQERVASREAVQEFEESVKASAIPQQEVGDINKEKLPGPEFLQSKSGTKDGQTVMIKEGDGSISAHQWSMDQQQWVMIGTVVDAPGSSGRKVEYQGQSYDYVFDVDIEDGKPPLKLPYNVSENPYDRAQRFLNDNELPVSYLESVANFIVQNTRGATLGQGGGSQSDPAQMGSQQDLKSSSQQQSSAAVPGKEYVTLLQAKFAPIEKKIASINADLLRAGRKDFALNPTELNTLAGLTQALAASTDKIPSVIPANSALQPSQSPRVTEPAIELILKLIKGWSYADRLPALDLLRCMVASETVAQYSDGVSSSSSSSSSSSVVEAALTSVTEAGSATDNKFVENSIMMALRVVTNMFATEAGRAVAAAKADKVVALMECILGISDTALGDLRGPVGANNRNVLIALTSAAINFGVLAHHQQNNGAVVAAADELALLMNIVGKVLTDQTDSEVVFRALVALGTLISIPGDGDYLPMAKTLGADEWVKTARKNASEDRVKNLVGVVSGLLR